MKKISNVSRLKFSLLSAPGTLKFFTRCLEYIKRGGANLMKKIYGEEYLKSGDEIYDINLDEEIVILDGERLTEDRAYKLGQELAIKLRQIYDQEENNAKPL
jgi:hypothetical protein